VVNKAMPDSEAFEIVLLGATGFVGSSILKHLIELPARVHALVRNPATFKPPRPVNVVAGDIRDTPARLFPRAPHVVIHFATKQIDSDNSGFEAINVEGTRRLMDRLPDSTRAILYGSSASVYGQENQIDLDESAPLRPETPLANSRAAAEQIILEAARARRITAYCMRPRFLFGLRDQHTLPGLVGMVRRGIQPGSGRQHYTIATVEDYARMLVALATRAMSLQEQLPLNVGYSRSVSLNDMTRIICARFGMQPPRIHVPVDASVTRFLRHLPNTGVRHLATRMELIGLSHTLCVDRLAARVAPTLLSRDPVTAFEAIVLSQKVGAA
jgi:nucleoside-diphosphate-sugar epimerase